MAHNSRDLPWRALANNLKFVSSNPDYNNVTNLYPRFESDQVEELQSFVKEFSRSMEEYSTKERARYPEELVPIADDEVFISDTTLDRIDVKVCQYKNPTGHQPSSMSTKNILGDEKRRIPYYIETLKDRQPATPVGYPDLVGPLEVLKRLLLYDEMEPLLRLADHPTIRFWAVWRPYKSDIRDSGWKYTVDAALRAYLCLNVLYLKPELHTTSSRTPNCEPMASDSKNDYRLTSSYQKMVVECTWPRLNDHETYTDPYREFFGIPRGLNYDVIRDNGDAYGVGKFSDLFELSLFTRFEKEAALNHTLSPLYTKPVASPTEPTGHSPEPYQNQNWQKVRFPRNWLLCRGELAAVIDILGKKGLPSELALEVLEYANYYPYCSLVVKDDPLHPKNREELERVLDYCWQLMVRFDMLWKANGTCIDWDLEVADAIFDMWGVQQPQMVQRYYECYHNGVHGRWRWETTFV
jgi:hypothetical protein